MIFSVREYNKLIFENGYSFLISEVRRHCYILILNDQRSRSAELHVVSDTVSAVRAQEDGRFLQPKKIAVLP